MNIRRVFAIFVRQSMLVWHNKTRFINIFLWFGLDIILWGFITKYLNTFATDGLDFIPMLLGAIILWNFLTSVQQGVMRAFFEDVWTQNFLNLFASPLRMGEYVLGLIVSGIVNAIFGLLFMILLAWLFGYSVFGFGFLLIPFLLILFMFGLALGVFTIGLMLKLGPSGEWLGWPIPFIIQPFVGVFYPVASLPFFAQPISKILPPTYAFEGMRGVLFSGVVNPYDLLLGMVLGVAYLFLAYWFFIAMYRHVLRTGGISRFSAENG